MVHADAVIGNSQGASRLVRRQHHPVVAVAFGQGGLGQRRITQPVASIRGVGDQLAEKDLFFAVERMRNNVEKAAYFRLEASCFLGHGLSSRLAERAEDMW